MATKLYNSHLNKLLAQCNEYYILDTYISLVHLSSEVNDKYIIQSYSDSKSELISLIKKHINTSYKTLYNCIDKLISLDILKYNHQFFGWCLVNMELMTKSKSDSTFTSQDSPLYSGYTHIRNFFFTEDFANMKAREKRLMIYMSQLADSKASNFHEDFSMNLLKPQSSWMKVLKTKCKYYAKNTIEAMLQKYNHLFVNKSEDLRNKDLSPNKNKRFKFLFDCLSIKKKPNDNAVFELVKNTNYNEYLLVKNKASFAQITLSNNKIMHLVRAISTLKEWFLKERVVQLIINKYIAIQIHKSREDIKSLPAYAAAVVRSVVAEYKEFKTSIKCKDIDNAEIGEYFIDTIQYTSEKLMIKSIEESLSLI